MSKADKVFLQHGYQPQPEEGKSIEDYSKIIPPKTISNAVTPKNNNLEEFIKLCIDKFGTDKAIICIEGKNWGIQPIKTDNKGTITDIQDGIAYYRANI